MSSIYTLTPESNIHTKWIAIFLVIGLHIVLIWSLWNAQIRQVIEQSAPLFVSLIVQAPPPPVEPPPEPPKPEPVKPKPIREPPPPEPPQIVSESPVLDVADFTAPPPPEPVVEEPAPVVAAPVVVQVTLPGLAVACPDRAPPVYPLKSKRMREQGEVVLQVYLDTAGKVARIEVNRTSGSPRLDEAALQAVQRWRCRPATLDGQPVAAVALQSINFVIN